MYKTFKIVISVISALILYLLYWLILPPNSIFYIEGAMYLGSVLLVITANIFMWLLWGNRKIDAVATLLATFMIPAIVVFIAILATMLFGGSPIFNDSKLQKQIGEVKQESFTEVITQLDNAQIPSVDADLASKQGDKLLGEDPGLGSRVYVGEFTIQSVNGNLEYIAPLEHNNFFRWWKNKTTPGYITVSATDSTDVKYVNTLQDGTSIQMRYQESAWWGDNLKRYLVMNCGYNKTGLTHTQFETDDSGRPFYIVNTYENTVFWGGAEVTGTIICDPQTGETTWYGINETPQWVDRIQSESCIKDQLSNYGSLVNGFWNTLFAKTDMLKVSDEVGVVYSNGNCYYYTGMTSVGSDNSTVGFYMVNTRTKEVIYFPIAGATESAARASAEGVVQEYGYYATYPIPLNVNGVPTYFMTLKDNEGLVKKYAMVNIQSYGIVAVGDNIAETKRGYMQAMASNGNTNVFSGGEAYSYSKTGLVSRILSTVENGNSYFYLTLDGDMTKIFSASYTISDELSITQVGDQVTIGYIDDGNSTTSLTSFDNLGIAIPVSEDQERKDELSEGATNPLEPSKDNSIVSVNPEEDQKKWDSLTEEEKSALLKKSDSGTN